MKFSFAIEKKNAANAGQMMGHNERHHPTKSQLDQGAWFTSEGSHVIKKFDHDLLITAKSMSKRKDAIFAVELVFSVGDQAEWRELPSEKTPEGASKAGNSKRLNQLIRATRAAVEAELGNERIISMVLHTDESTPHVHVVFAPILDGKLNAKHWTGGATKCAQLREKMHGHFNKIFPCEYTKGNPGGEPHDPTKAAGKENAPRPKPEKQGLVKTAMDAISSRDEVKALRDQLSAAKAEISRLFSQMKAFQLKAQKEFDEQREKLLESYKKRDDAEKKGRASNERIKELETRLGALEANQKARPGVGLVQGLKRP